MCSADIIALPAAARKNAHRSIDYPLNLTHLLLAGAGGCIGSMARFLAVVSIDRKLSSVFPYGTLVVNVGGSFVLGFILAWLTKRAGAHPEHWKIFLGTGFCGGFTTFSAFAAENVHLFQQKLPATALLYIAGSVIAGIFSVWMGFAAARAML